MAMSPDDRVELARVLLAVTDTNIQMLVAITMITDQLHSPELLKPALDKITAAIGAQHEILEVLTRGGR